ncbi:uncharacterized protein LOC112574344 isoform X2 [Pomacea canaliculata]|nr:uncharacterized protein LOC112574344 isoform X2 [Pomacea canaliculata]XP_025111161.1 uncharacterized protein LOC112574344 isoform X2 [Pomacea canaliculata]
MTSRLLFWCTFVAVLSLPSAIRTYTIEEKCPVFNDETWKARNSRCEEGKKYHCQDNEDGKREAHGCFRDKVCKKGAHPVIENGQVICLDCPEGSYQKNELISSQYTYSMCSPHSTCVPYEKTLCKAGTQEQDTMCKCSQSHTPSPKECDCFTNNDVCYCKHIGCPNGTSINEDGSCSSPTIPTPSPSTNETLPEPGLSTFWKIASVIAGGIIIASAAAFGIYCYRRRRNSNPEGQTDSQVCNGGLLAKWLYPCCLKTRESTASQDSHDKMLESINNRPLIYIGRARNVHISACPNQNGHCVNLNHGGESDETINQMNDSEEVSPDIESFNNSLLHHGGESNGSISHLNTSEEVHLDMLGNQIPFPIPIPVSSAIDSLTETDSVPSAGQTVSCGSQEAGISGRPLHEDDTVPKMVCDRTQRSQESHVFEEPNETDKLLHCPLIYRINTYIDM